MYGGMDKKQHRKTELVNMSKTYRLPALFAQSPKQSLINESQVVMSTCVKVEPRTDSLTQACGRLGLKYKKPVFFTWLLP